MNRLADITPKNTYLDTEALNRIFLKTITAFKDVQSA